jgi:hypothetical protein
MRKIAVEKIEDNMVLARDVSSTSGNVLLGKGTALTETMGRRLKNWSIFFVYIEGEEESLEQQQTVEVSAEEVRDLLEKKFSGHLDDPIMQKLFNAVFEFSLNRKHG